MNFDDEIVEFYLHDMNVLCKLFEPVDFLCFRVLMIFRFSWSLLIKFGDGIELILVDLYLFFEHMILFLKIFLI
jgi:hypothetical protein